MTSIREETSIDTRGELAPEARPPQVRYLKDQGKLGHSECSLANTD